MTFSYGYYCIIIYVAVQPAIISKELFDKAQERLEWNKTRYRTPKRQQLLSLLIHCGHCGSTFCAYQRYYIRNRKTLPKQIYHHFAYRCARRFWIVQHSKKSLLPRCPSTERNARALEAQVFHLIENIMLEPTKLREFIDIFKTQRPVTRMEKELEKIEKCLRNYEEKKRRITDVYAAGDLTKEEYVARSRIFDCELAKLTQRKIEILQQIPLYRKRSLIDAAIEQYCETAKLRYKKADDYETKRQFLLDHVEKIIFWNDKIAVHGKVPVTIDAEFKGRKRVGESETHQIEFRIAMNVTTTATKRWGVLKTGVPA